MSEQHSPSRSKNTKRNLITGFINKLVTLLLPFLIRTAIIYALGEQFLGLSSLFTSILQVLNLAELGFSNAVVFSMYRPLSEGNDGLVCAILAYYRKTYRIIGGIILGCGLLIMPWLAVFIKGAWPDSINIYFLYFLYLLNTSISYFLFGYRSALLNALQRIDITNNTQTVVYTLKYVLQLVVLLIFQNYYVYVIVAIIATLFNNLVTAYISNKKFPQYTCRGELSDEVRKEIKTQIKGLMICKLSDTSRNSFDSIVLSSLIGLTVVAIYNNYFYIFSAIYGFLLIITHAMQASVGNSITSESPEKNYNDLKKFQFLFSWITAFCSISLSCLYQPFMEIWVGKDLSLNEPNMLLFVLYFYVLNLNNMRNLYFTGNGLWWEGRRSFVLEAIGNLLLNLGLGYCFGVTGILIATIITIFVFNFVVRTNILFKQYFKISPREFYLEHIVYFIVTVVIGITCYFICRIIPLTEYAGLLCRALVCLVIPNVLWPLCFLKKPLLRQSKHLIINAIKAKR